MTVASNQKIADKLFQTFIIHLDRSMRVEEQKRQRENHDRR